MHVRKPGVSLAAEPPPHPAASRLPAAANWMLEVTSGEAEKAAGHDFAKLYRHSELAEAADATVSKFRCGGHRQGCPVRASAAPWQWARMGSSAGCVLPRLLNALNGGLSTLTQCVSRFTTCPAVEVHTAPGILHAPCSVPEPGAKPTTVADMHPASQVQQAKVLLLRNSRWALRKPGRELRP